MILKTLGAQFVSVPGTTTGGLEMVRAFLAGLGLDPAAAALADGSGLSDQSRTSAELLAGVLAKAQGDFEIGPELVSSLPIGGADGTLSERFPGEASRRRVRAKTGRIAGAISLAGYVSNRSGRMFAFVVLANQARGTVEAVQRAIDPLVDAVAGSTNDDLPPADVP
jgi:D-alanyl-D-alanine carboxypeptidase/D-alanyl-D-alanine-endopeptidase (penicillin-binding protein 4)